MNTRLISKFSFLAALLLAALLSACAGAAPRTPIAAATQAPAVESYASGPAQTEAPAAQVEAPAPAVAGAPLPSGQSLPEPRPTPSDNTFRDYGLNPYVDAAEDHLSTFALDVDTASYTVARRYLRDGNLPPAESVRVEEFVNYFDPGYANPANVAFGIYADGAPSPFAYDGTQLLRFGIQGYQVSEAERKPATLTFVIDVSGSMDMENRLGLVKRSLELLVERLRPTDTVAIVVYGSEARMVLPPTSAENPGTILDAIYSLRPEGSTNAEAGLRLGYQYAWNAFRPGTSNRVILCTDGVANVGATGPEAILNEIRGYVDQGITLAAMGFGMGNFNDVLLERLADDGDGFYAYIDDVDEARKLFVEGLTSTLQVIARDAKVQVDFNPEVVSRYRLIGYENRAIADQDFRNDAVDAGELGAGHHATALYAVVLKPGAQGRIATVQLRWEDPDTREVKEINGNFNTWDLSDRFESAAPRYRLAVLAAQFAELLRSSPWAENSSLAQVRDFALLVANELGGDPEVAEFAGLVDLAARSR